MNSNSCSIGPVTQRKRKFFRRKFEGDTSPENSSLVKKKQEEQIPATDQTDHSSGNKENRPQNTWIAGFGRCDLDSEEQQDNLGTQRSSKSYDDFDNTQVGSAILNEIRSGYHSRLKTRKQKLDECFKDVKGIPKKIEDENSQLAMERQKQVEVARSHIVTVIDRLEKIHELQSINKAKMDLMVASFQKSHTQAREATDEVVNGLQQILQHYNMNMEQVEEKHELLTKKQMEQCKRQLNTLHQKILDASKDEEKRRLLGAGFGAI